VRFLSFISQSNFLHFKNVIGKEGLENRLFVPIVLSSLLLTARTTFL